MRACGCSPKEYRCVCFGFWGQFWGTGGQTTKTPPTQNLSSWRVFWSGVSSSRTEELAVCVTFGRSVLLDALGSQEKTCDLRIFPR